MINKLFPLLNAVDDFLSNIISLSLRLCFFGLIAGVLAISIYAKISPQASINSLKQRGRKLRQKMKNSEMEFKAFYSMAIENLKISLKLLCIIIGPALISAIPVLILSAWIHTYYGYNFWQSAPKDFLVKPEPGYNIKLVFHEKDNIQSGKLTDINYENINKMTIFINGNSIYTGDPFRPPAPLLYKRKWWNILIGNSAGYLAEDAPVDYIHLNFQKKVILGWTPKWVSGWVLPFFVSVLVVALVMKRKLKIQ